MSRSELERLTRRYTAELSDWLGPERDVPALQFAAGHFARIANDAALRTAERDIHHRAFPGHPGGKRAHFVNAYIRRESNPALPGSAHGRMQHAIAGENFQLPVVHSHRDVQR